MIITIEEIKNVFNEYNAKAFDNELPMPRFELMSTKSLLGQLKRNRVLGEMCYTIRISTYYDRAFEGFRNTIVHEMLHYYIRFKGIKDTSSHGRIWKTRAAELNRNFPELQIQRCSDVQGDISDVIKEKKSENGNKYEYVALCIFEDKMPYACVIPSNKLFKFYTELKCWKKILDVKIIYAPWSETYKLKHIKTRCSIRRIEKCNYNRLMEYKEVKIY